MQQFATAFRKGGGRLFSPKLLVSKGKLAQPNVFTFQSKINSDFRFFPSQKLNKNSTFGLVKRKSSHLSIKFEDLAIYVKRFDINSAGQRAFFGVSIFKILNINQRAYI